MSRGIIRVLTFLPFLALLLTACTDGVGPRSGDARITVLLTDAAANYLEQANVEIGAVHINPAQGPPVLMNEYGGWYNLLELQNGATAMLAQADVEPGRFLWLRLVVSGANVELKDPWEFTDGTTERDLFVPSGAQRGIQINLRYADDDHQAAGVEIRPGETILVVDFDVNQSFKIQGSPETPAGIKSMLFTPLLRATVEDVAGSIAGTVIEPEDFEWPEDPEISLSDLIVRATLVDSDEIEELQTPSGTSTIAEDGSYKIWFLAPGNYTVTVEHPGFANGENGDPVPSIEVTVDPESRSISVGRGEDVTGVDFELVDVEVVEPENGD